MMTTQNQVPTNILTGFLGAGKTSAILHLLQQKPDNERWAVLVNEFGEIGVDGSLFQGRHKEESGIYIREVPGGCMCCAAGLPMQMALNLLLARAKPQRLLIEPTGLGHPIEVLQSLSSGSYQDWLSVQQIITLVDARHLAENRYAEHRTFNQQIAIADVVVGNKRDLYGPEDESKLQSFVKQRGQPGADLIFTEQGRIDLKLLNGPPKAMDKVCSHTHLSNSEPQPPEAELPECGYLKAINQGEGFESVGWRFTPERIFDRNKLFNLFNGLCVERMKAVFLTEDGVFGYNLAGDGLTEVELDDCLESRIEIIAIKTFDNWEQQLLDCQAQAD